jgi:hypothetical protein
METELRRIVQASGAVPDDWAGELNRRPALEPAFNQEQTG